MDVTTPQDSKDSPRHQEVKVGTGRIIVTEENIVFSGGDIPILADPVEELRTALDEIERLREILRPVCRVCGCTEFNACEGGCYWVEPDLCSACVDEPEAMTGE